jgi:CRP-like cAMP-binding protein
VRAVITIQGSASKQFTEDRMFPALQPISPSAIAAQSSVTPDMLGIRAAQVAVIRAERDEDIVAQGDEAGYCCLVVSGCVRTVRLMEDGRRQVGAFLFVGDCSAGKRWMSMMSVSRPRRR